MKQILKYTLVILTLGLFASAFTSCLESEDLMTDGAKTGGLVSVTKSVPYKLGATPNFTVSINVLKGPAVNSIKVYKYFIHNADTSQSSEVLLTTVDINGQNTSNDYTAAFTSTWNDLVNDLPKLPKGYSVPTNEMLADIGDAFKLVYYSVLPDGREVLNNAKTTVSVANFFAGTYNVTGYFYHPSSPRSINEEKILTAKSATTCYTTFGDFKDPEWLVNISIDSNNNVTLTFTGDDYGSVAGDPNDPSHVCTYNPQTKVIELWYWYMGGTGVRMAYEIYTPK